MLLSQKRTLLLSLTLKWIMMEKHVQKSIETMIFAYNEIDVIGSIKIRIVKKKKKKKNQLKLCRKKTDDFS